MNQLVKIILALVLIASIVFSLDLHFKNKSKIERLTDNIESLGAANSTLKFTNDELKSYLRDKDTEHKREVDSILKLLKIKPKNLIRYESIKVNNLNVDSTLSLLETPKVKNDSIYQVDFYNVRECLKIKGYVESLDPNPKVVITSDESSNVIYVVKSYKKSFWDKIFFRKGKEIIQTTSECGEVDLNEIDIIK